MSEPTIAQLSSALDRAKMMGFHCSISFGHYSDCDHYSLRLYQCSNSKANISVEGDGSTLEEAIRKCFANFPENPLDGTGWANNRLAPPASKPNPIDAEFTEIHKE